MSDNNLEDDDFSSEELFTEESFANEEKVDYSVYYSPFFLKNFITPIFFGIGFFLMFAFLGDSWFGYVIGNILVFLGYLFSNQWRKDCSIKAQSNLRDKTNSNINGNKRFKTMTTNKSMCDDYYADNEDQ